LPVSTAWHASVLAQCNAMSVSGESFQENADAGRLAARAIALFESGALDEAASLCRQALASEPDNLRALNLLGVLSIGKGRLQEAIVLFRRALRIEPRNIGCWTNLAVALNKSGDLTGAIEAATRRAELVPDDPAALDLLGELNERASRFDEAVACFRSSFRLRPGAASLMGIGRLLLREGRAIEAMRWYDEVIGMRIPDAKLFWALADHLNKLGRHGRARAACLTALDMGLVTREILANLGEAETGLLQHVRAVDAYERALTLDPDYPPPLVNLAGAISHLCDWGRARRYQAAAVARTFRAIDRGERFSLTPFTALTLDLSPLEQRRIAEHYVRTRHPRYFSSPPAIPRCPTGERIVVGYLSGDFRDHPVSHLARNLFKHHDRRRFRIVAYSTGPDDGSIYRKHIAATCDDFVDVRSQDAGAIAARMRDDGVAVLVDMAGHTGHARLDVLALRPAPVQLHFLGYPGTLGAPFVDYFVTDHYLSPAGAETHFTERLIYMPDTYQISDDEQQAAVCPVSRAVEGLPAGAFVFCCFNSAYKIEPVIFACWMEILRRCPGSVLWLLSGLDLVASNLRAAAAAHGVAPERLIFARRTGKPEHLARHVLADLFLDTHRVCGHTTANDALQAGLPVLAWPRQNFISRVSASLLHAHGLGELVCASADEYVGQATALWGDRRRLAGLRRRLVEGRGKVPARDTGRFVRHLELAYLRALELRRASCPPESIDVAALARRTHACAPALDNPGHLL